ncbi:Hypothetical predicted protein [Mytilus galloprovincialis]|uniref:DZIP3-like HEPN domain-containing protein n=1 Tax=Mytilus galloprovincialis TaxID=29158 RepID=A0A8B6GI50_MYTGA|nr:Hypothetical predicted protein [Mytilus galloprovincialis]
MDLMYPNTGYTSSDNYDVTLMICLLRNLSTISPPSLGYDKLPPATEISDGADLARIKYHRNLIAHADKDELTTGEFNTMWACVYEAVLRLGGAGYRTTCEDLSQLNLNKDVLINVRQDITEFRSEMKDQIISLQADLGKVKHEQAEIREQAGKFQDDLCYTQTAQTAFKEDVTVKTKDLQNDIKTIKIDQNTLSHQVTACRCEGIHKLQIEEWENKERKFVKTPVSEYVSNILLKENSVTVTGQPGIGKSGTIHHVALSMLNGDAKYAIIPCKNPSDIVNHYKLETFQIFVIDDVCGKYTINHYDVEEWIKYKDDIVRILEKDTTKLLVSVRLQVFQDEQFKRIGIFLKNICDLSSKQFLLSSNIKLKIAKAYLPKNVIKAIGQRLDKYDYLPLLCMLYSQNPNMNAIEYFENPFIMYKKELDQMYTQMNKTKLCALFLLVLFDDCLLESNIRDVKFRNKLELIFDSCNVNRGTPTDSIIGELNTLTRTYLEKDVMHTKHVDKTSSVSYHAVHDKMFDFLCSYFGGKFQKCMLRFADDNIICSRMQLRSVHEKKKAFEILIENYNEQFYFDRIADMLGKGKMYDVVCNRQMQFEIYRSKLISHLQLLNKDKIHTLLHAQDKNGKTLTYLVCLLGYTDLVQFILERTDDINADHLSTYPPLVGACKRGDDIIVQLLLFKGANVNKSDVSKQSPLIMALKGCDYSERHVDSSTSQNHSLIVDMLIENGALMDNLKRFYKCFFIQKNVSRLIGASSLGKLRMVKSFIQRGDVLDETDTRKYTPLHWAIYNGHFHTAKYLIDLGSNLLITEQDGRNAFMIACYSGCTEIVRYLLTKEFYVNQANDKGWTPLLYAINGMGEAGNSVTTVTFLINKGADVSLCNKDGLTPLMLSCKHGFLKITESILEKHIDIDINQADMSGISALMYASLHGHTAMCILLLSKGANIHVVDYKGWTCLMWSCFMGFTSTAEWLISVGSEIDNKDMQGDTALLLASKYGNTEIAFLLISKGVHTNNPDLNVENTALILAATDTHQHMEYINRKKAYTYAANKNSNTALSLATEGGHADIEDLHIKKSSDLNVANNDGKTALILAIEHDHTDIINLLITMEAEVNANDKYGNTALRLATKRGRTDIVVLLIAKGADVNVADVNVADKDRGTALMLAAEHGHTDIVDLLIEKGADVNAADKDGRTDLMLAAELGRTDIVDLLIEKGADVNVADKDERTALMLAAELGRTDIVVLLIEKGADVNVADKDERTALMLAAELGRTDIVVLLIEKGADVNVADKDKRTALMLAAELGRTDTVELLIQKGADVNVADKDKRTALMLAAELGRTDTVELLIQKGAGVNAADKDERTALMLAAERGRTDIVDLLIEKGADVNAADKDGNTALILATRLSYWQQGVVIHTL